MALNVPLNAQILRELHDKAERARELVYQLQTSAGVPITEEARATFWIISSLIRKADELQLTIAELHRAVTDNDGEFLKKLAEKVEPKVEPKYRSPMAEGT